MDSCLSESLDRVILELCVIILKLKRTIVV